ncbi:MAG TPA: ABC transporter permease, partial [Oceanipulchritudo sp.]|nr:ABC transporter permease [Oceanipulchritudo sp.]
MFKFIARRILQSIIVLFVIVTVTFFMVHAAPGDPFSADRKMPEHIKQRLMEHYGLDKPLMVQYGHYLGSLVQGDLGPSHVETRSVNRILSTSFPVSLELGSWALLIALGIGLPVGIISAVFKNTLADYI